jgi:hypothetical protein
MTATKSKNLTLEFPNRSPLTIHYRKDSEHARDLKEIDALVIETNSGFNDLGLYTKNIAKEMNIDKDIIRGFGDSLLKEKQPIIHIFPTQSSTPTLRAVAMISNPNCDSYKPFRSSTGRPSKDFFYNITYEALAALIDMGNANIGIAGLTGSLQFVEDSQYKNAVAEAICHVAYDNPSLKTIQILSFGPYITYGLNYFNQNQGELKKHKKIKVIKEDYYGIKRLTLTIPRRF